MTRPSPRTVKIGVIGGGSIAKAHIIGLRGISSYFGDDGVRAEVAVVADVNRSVAESTAHRSEVDRWSTDWRAVVEDDSLDAVTIAVPNDVHALVAEAAAQAGKHVLCEKPLAESLASGRRMVQAVTDAGVTNSVNLNYRNIPAIRYAKRLIADGELGAIVNFRGAFLQDWAADPRVPRSWKFEAGRAGAGPLLGVGCHVVDLAHFLVGDITQVVASTRTTISQRPSFTGASTYAAVESSGAMGAVDTDDLAAVLLRFRDGALGTLETSRVSRGRKNHCAIEVNGTLGSITFDYERMNELCVATDRSTASGPTRVVIGPEQDGGLFWSLGGLGIGFAETVVLQMREFVRAIAGGTPADPAFVDGLRAQAVVEAALESARSGAWRDVA